jgi:hypothetical protein
MKVAATVINATTREAVGMANVYVSDAEGKPVEPVRGTTTDFDGKFELAADAQAFITISAVGMGKYIGQAINTNGSIYLKPSVEQLREFVVEARRITPAKIGLGLAGIAVILDAAGVIDLKKIKAQILKLF